MLIDDLGVFLFVDDLGAVWWFDDLGQQLGGQQFVINTV